MHKCYTIQDWIRAWAQGEREADQLGVILAGDCMAEGTSSLDHAYGPVLDGGPGVPYDVVNCPRCMATCDELDELLEQLEHFDPIVAAEFFEADFLFETLAASPAEEHSAVIANDDRFRTWGLCQRFLSAAESLWRHDPPLSHSRALTGLFIAEALDEETYHPQWVADLRAKAHAYVGNCLRILARFEAANRQLAIAARYLCQGVKGGQREARILSLQASLCIDQDRYEEAEALLIRVEAFYEARGQRTEIARTQLKRATIFGIREAYRSAAEECARAYTNLDPARESKLAALARQNAAFYLLCGGDVVQARALFSSLPPTDERMVLVQRRWIEADLLRAEGKLDLAMDAYDDTRRRYANENLPFDVALVSLDQAVAALEMGDHVRMDELAREASVLLGEANAPAEALAILRAVETALEEGTVSRSVLTALRRRLADARPRR